MNEGSTNPERPEPAPQPREMFAAGHKPPGASLFDVPWFARHLGYRAPITHGDPETPPLAILGGKDGGQ